ncbi:MAG: arsenite methyltransferase [Myxococcota bacterium]
MTLANSEKIRKQIRKTYGDVAKAEPSSSGCCSGGQAERDIANIHAERLGYSREDAESVPEGANLGLGCGNPSAIAAIEPGETVLDLGAGAGFDAFLAADQVGDEGLVIGVDMTPEMVEKARQNAEDVGATNISFRLGEIEHLPVPDSSVNAIISNCVINLSPDKPRVFAEAFRVLEPGGRLAISDVVATAEIPEEMREDLELHSCCVSGASTIDSLESMLEEAGFVDIRIEPKGESREFIREWVPDVDVDEFVRSASIEAKKPAKTGCC